MTARVVVTTQDRRGRDLPLAGWCGKSWPTRISLGGERVPEGQGESLRPGYGKGASGSWEPTQDCPPIPPSLGKEHQGKALWGLFPGLCVHWLQRLMQEFILEEHHRYEETTP